MEKFYRPGLVFLSKHAGYQLILAQPEYHIFPSGEREETQPTQIADFRDESIVGTWRSDYTDYEGRHLVVANKRGGAFDLDEAADRLGWSDEQKETAARKLIRAATNRQDPAYGDVTLWEPPVPTAPWKSFDQSHHNRIAVLAEELGMVAEALVYERATKNRDGVVKALEEKLNEQAVSEELTAA